MPLKHAEQSPGKVSLAENGRYRSKIIDTFGRSKAYFACVHSPFQLSSLIRFWQQTEPGAFDTLVVFSKKKWHHLYELRKARRIFKRVHLARSFSAEPGFGFESIAVKIAESAQLIPLLLRYGLFLVKVWLRGDIAYLIVGNIADLRGFVLSKIAEKIGVVVAVDDGALGFHILESRESDGLAGDCESAPSAPEIVRRRASSVRQLIMFTAMPLSEGKKTSILRDHGFFPSIKPIQNRLLFITGTNWIDSRGGVDVQDCLDLIIALTKHYPGWDIEYYPHRAEPATFLARLRQKGAGQIKVHDHEFSFETVVGNLETHPELMLCAPSTLAFILERLINPLTSFRMFKISHLFKGPGANDAAMVEKRILALLKFPEVRPEQ